MHAKHTEVTKDLIDLYITYVTNHRKMASETYKGMSKKHLEKYLREMLESYKIEKIYEADKLIGFCIYYTAKTPYSGLVSLYICDFAISPNFHKKGYGTKLMDTMFEIAKKEKCKEIHLTVHAKNSAIDFYDRHGFFISTHTMVSKI